MRARRGQDCPRDQVVERRESAACGTAVPVCLARDPPSGVVVAVCAGRFLVCTATALVRAATAFTSTETALVCTGTALASGRIAPASMAGFIAGDATVPVRIESVLIDDAALEGAGRRGGASGSAVTRAPAARLRRIPKAVWRFASRRTSRLA